MSPELVPIRLLTEDSVDRLRVESRGERALAIWSQPLETIARELELKFTESHYQLDPSIRLDRVAGRANELPPDGEASLLALRALPGLTAAEATDERLWVTLALDQFRDYRQTRWPLRGVDLSSHLRLHLFAGSARGRERDQAISRLWWTGTFVKNLGFDDLQVGLDALFINSDLPVQLLGRANLAMVRPFARAFLLRTAHEVATAEGRYSRKATRKALQEFDLIAARRALGAMPEDELRQIVEEVFHRLEAST